MKFIDEKGRLFGKINVIDFLVILFLSFLVPMFYFSYKIVTKKPPAQPKEFLELKITCNLIRLSPEILKLIAIGDKEIDIEGKTISEITWIGESKPFQELIDIGSSQKIEAGSQVLKRLPVELKIQAEVKGDIGFYNNQKIYIGRSFTFRTNKYVVEAIPVVER